MRRRAVRRTVGDVQVEGAMQSPDGRWRVEIVRRGRSRWYRLITGDSEIDWLSIAAVQRLLADAGVDMGTLVDAPVERSEPGELPDQDGVA